MIPAALVDYVAELVGAGNLVDAQQSYYRIKYQKSNREMELIAQAARIADALMEAMLRVIRPGTLETQVAA